MSIKVRQFKKSLSKKGFVGPTNTHHQYYNYEYNGKQTRIRTYVSQGDTEINNKRIINTIKKDMRFDSLEDLYEFVKCDLSKDDYERILKEKSEI